MYGDSWKKLYSIIIYLKYRYNNKYIYFIKYDVYQLIK